MDYDFEIFLAFIFYSVFLSLILGFLYVLFS